ncbi:MAG: hypothetical protein O6929_08025, partial [candidate division NC10 bacterium]|nr:hypothetical protein [candidate division NC10 bacterium]
MDFREKAHSDSSDPSVGFSCLPCGFLPTIKLELVHDIMDMIPYGGSPARTSSHPEMCMPM